MQFLVGSKSFQGAYIITKTFPAYQLLDFDPTATLLISWRR